MKTLKKPPDKYKCIKVHFSSLLKDNVDYSIIFDSIVSIHKITIKIYQLLRLYILHCYHQKIQINPIDKILLRKIKNVISRAYLNGECIVNVKKCGSSKK